MKNTIVIVPTEHESAFFADHGIRARVCGVGMAECAATTAHIIAMSLAGGREPAPMILAGIAGTYTDEIEIGETVAVTSETVADLGRLSGGALTPLFQTTYTGGIVPRGLRGVRSNTTSTAGGIIVRPPEAEIENMEGAAFFAVCARFGVPAMEVRTVSNRVGERIGGKNMDIAIHRLALDLAKIVASCA
jgi:nucleoside phosphorylase